MEERVLNPPLQPLKFLQVDSWCRTVDHRVHGFKFHTFLIFFPPKIAYKKKIRRRWQ
jgi:hypothetical protein